MAWEGKTHASRRHLDGRRRDRNRRADALTDRDPDALVTVAFGLPGVLRSHDELARLRDLEADHATVWMAERGEGVFEEMEKLAHTWRGVEA